MYSYCSMCIYYFINFTFVPFLLSLLCAQQTQWLLLFSSSFSSDAHKHTHTQTHPHRQINTEIHKHTRTQTNQQRDRSVLDLNDRCLIDACGMISAWSVLVEWSVLVGLVWSVLVGLAWSELDWEGVEIGSCWFYSEGVWYLFSMSVEEKEQ